MPKPLSQTHSVVSVLCTTYLKQVTHTHTHTIAHIQHILTTDPHWPANTLTNAFSFIPAQSTGSSVQKGHRQQRFDSVYDKQNV